MRLYVQQSLQRAAARIALEGSDGAPEAVPEVSEPHSRLGTSSTDAALARHLRAPCAPEPPAPASVPLSKPQILRPRRPRRPRGSTDTLLGGSVAQPSPQTVCAATPPRLAPVCQQQRRQLKNCAAATTQVIVNEVLATLDPPPVPDVPTEFAVRWNRGIDDVHRSERHP